MDTYKSPELDRDPAKKVGIAEQIVLYADPIGIGGHRYLKIQLVNHWKVNPKLKALTFEKS